MRERRSWEDVEEQDSSDGDSDAKSQDSQMERVLELVVEIVRMKKIQYIANGQIDAINTRTNNNENTVAKNARMSAD